MGDHLATEPHCNQFHYNLLTTDPLSPAVLGPRVSTRPPPKISQPRRPGSHAVQLPATSRNLPDPPDQAGPDTDLSSSVTSHDEAAAAAATAFTGSIQARL